MAQLFAEISNLDDPGISLPDFHSRTNLKLTSTMVKNLLTDFDSFKASSPDYISKVVLKNCGPELSYILADLFSMCLKESSFPDWWNVSFVVPVSKNVKEKSTAKNDHPVSLNSMTSKIFGTINHLDKYGLFSDFQ